MQYMNYFIYLSLMAYTQLFFPFYTVNMLQPNNLTSMEKNPALNTGPSHFRN